MTNKIDGCGAQPLGQAGRVRSAEPNARSSEGKAGAPEGADSVRLTGDAVTLLQMEQRMAEMPAVDLRRVAEIRSALRDGSYRIDPQAIAGKLARMEWELAAP